MIERNTRGLLVAGACLISLAATPPAAQAGTAYVSDDGAERVLRYEAAAGELNQLSLSRPTAGSTGYRLSEAPQDGGPQATITPGAGCTPVGQLSVLCDAAGLDRIELALGDGDDQVQVFSSDLPVRADGGAGNDVFDDPEIASGTPGRTFLGGPGDDLMRAGGSGSLRHIYSGGAGTDTVAYYWRSQPLTITIDDTWNDGAPGEADSVENDVEVVIGGPATDSIAGDSIDAASADHLVGNGGADSLEGFGGDDRLVASFACEADVLVGGGGADVLELGGATQAIGGKDDDRFVSRRFECADGAGDDVHGGAGIDTADFGEVHGFVFVSLDEVADDGSRGFDNFRSDLENVRAGNGDTAMIGNAEPNALFGGPGDDLLDGAGGGDRLDGGGGTDVADYSERSLPVDLSLNGASDDGEAGEGDRIASDVEALRGGTGDDALAGDDADNVLDGGPGSDAITGGAGLDAVDYFEREAAVTVDLSEGSGGEPGEQDEIAPDVEGAFGGLGDDTLIGAETDGFLAGFEGDDDLSDAGGEDLLDAGEGADAVDSVDGAADSVVCGPGEDEVRSDAIDVVAEDCAPESTPEDPEDPGDPEDPDGPGGAPGGPGGGPGAPRIPPARPQPPALQPLDREAPTGSVRLPGGQRLRGVLARGLRVGAVSTEAGVLSAALTAESATRRVLRRLGLAAATELARGQVDAAPGARQTLKLRLTRAGRRVLRAVPAARLRLVVTLTDRAGNAANLVRHLRLRR